MRKSQIEEKYQAVQADTSKGIDFYWPEPGQIEGATWREVVKDNVSLYQLNAEGRRGKASGRAKLAAQYQLALASGQTDEEVFLILAMNLPEAGKSGSALHTCAKRALTEYTNWKVYEAQLVLQGRLDTKDGQIEELEEEVARARENAVAADRKKEEFKRETRRVVSGVENMEIEMKELRTERDGLKEQLESTKEFEERAKSLESELDQLRSTVEELEAAKRELAQASPAAATQKPSSRSESPSMSSSEEGSPRATPRPKASRRKKRAGKRRGAEEVELEMLKNEIKSLTSNLKKAKEELEEKKAQNKQLEAQVIRLSESSPPSVESNSAELKSRIRVLEGEVEVLQLSIKDTSIDRSKEMQAMDEMKSELARTRQQLSGQRDMNSQLARRGKALNERLKAAEVELRDTHAKLQHLSRAVKPLAEEAQKVAHGEGDMGSLLNKASAALSSTEEKPGALETLKRLLPGGKE